MIDNKFNRLGWFVPGVSLFNNANGYLRLFTIVCDYWRLLNCVKPNWGLVKQTIDFIKVAMVC